MKLQLSNAPCSWGVEFAGNPDNPGWQSVLDDIQQAGYGATELGPLGYMPTDTAVLREALEARGLQLLAGTLFHYLHDAAKRDEILDFTRRSCEILQPLGAKYMVVIDHVASPRTDQAGQVETATRLDRDAWNAMMETIRQAANICVDHDITPTLHAHTGTFIEYRDELDKAMNDLHSDLVSLCIDTGHCQYAGMNPAEVIRTYADRVKYLHFKDIDAAVHQRVVAGKIDFYKAVSAGVFTPLGKGCVDFPAVRRVLNDIGFDGWVTVEQDMDPTQDADPLSNARQSREFIEQAMLH
ncbi:MAG: TIM barrel protein [Thiolinea sp.]